MKVISQITILFLICFVSELISNVMPIPFPASVVGMIILFLLLAFKVIKTTDLKESTDFLLSNMSFFFFPALINIVNYFDLIKNNMVILLFIAFLTMVLTFMVVVLSVNGIIFLQEKIKEKKHA